MVRITSYLPAGRCGFGVVPISVTTLSLALVCSSRVVQAASLTGDNIEQGAVSRAAAPVDTAAPGAGDVTRASQPTRPPSSPAAAEIGGRPHQSEMRPMLRFLVEPQLAAQVRVSRWMRLAVYAGDRFVSPVQAAGLETSSVAGPVLGAQAQWGWF